MTDVSQPPGRLAAIDFGTVRIGIALTDPQQRIASPWATYQRRNPAADAEYFRTVAGDQKIVRFVVGLPVHLDGRESEKSRQARQFAAWLERQTQVPVVLFDERFTSVEAEQLLAAARLTRKRRKARCDPLAAQILLTAYLEAGCPDESAAGRIDDQGSP